MSFKLAYKKYYIVETPSINSENIRNINTTIQRNTPDIRTNSQLNSLNNKIYYDEIVQYIPNDNITYQGIEGTYIKNNNPYNIYDLSKYISNRLVNLIDQLQLVNRCNKYGSPNSDAIPADCSNAFIGYTTNSNIKLQNSIPLYTSTYLISKKKHLQQQVNDVKNLIDSFNDIVVSIKNDTTIPSGDFEQLLRTNRENVKIRGELDLKLGEIYEYNSSNIVKSRVNLDTTVYTGVLWSILATSLAYFVFVKL